MKPLFIALLHNLHITEDLGDGDKIRDDLRVLNDKVKIGSLLSPTHRTIIGEMESGSLMTGAPVVISQSDFPVDMSPQEYLVKRLYEVQSFLMTTWMVQDNAINCELGFVLYSEGNISRASSNFIAHLYSTAAGERPAMEWSREELRQARTLYRTAVGSPAHPFLMPTSQLTSEHPRLARAIYLIGAARGESDVAIKVAHYCSAFETLFSTSQAELAHQLSERLSCYLFTGIDARLSAYRSLKSAYGIRSKVVHGSTIKDEKLVDVQSASRYCDQAARSFFQKVFAEPSRQKLFEQDPTSFDEQLLRFVFSGTAA